MNTTKKGKGTRSTTLEILFHISNLINTTVDRQKVLQGILKEVVRITNATSGSIAMFNRETGVLDIEVAIGIPKQRWSKVKLHLGVGVTGYAAYKGKALLVNDVHRNPHYVSIKRNVRSELAVPMFQKRELIGVINVDSTEKNAFTETQKQLLTVIAEQAARVIETTQLYGQLQNYSDQMKSLFSIGRLLTTPATPKRLMERIVFEAQSLKISPAIFLGTYSPQDEELRSPTCSGFLADATLADSLPIDETLFHPMTQTNAPLVLENLDEHLPIWQPDSAPLRKGKSLVAMPLLFSNTFQGVICFLFDRPKTMSDKELSLMQLLANQASIVMENAYRREQISIMEDTLHKTERFSLLGTLAAEIAHEVRNPLTIINLMLDGLSEDVKNNRAQKDLNTIREKIQRIENIVDQTLDLSRGGNLELESVNINEMVKELMVFLAYKFQKSDVEIVTSFSQSLLPVEINRGQFHQVILNLFLNAIEAMPSGGKVHVATRLTSDAIPSVSLTIRDTGMGIEAQHLENLFEPFYTTRADGTGLGLFISQKIVQKFNGTLSCKSKTGQGSTFKVLLPLPDRVWTD